MSLYLVRHGTGTAARRCIVGLLAVAASGAAAAQAATTCPNEAPTAAARERDPACVAAAPEQSGTGGAAPGTAYKGYLPAALEIVGFQVLLNRFDNAFIGSDYDVSLDSFRRNLHSSWVVDRDPFQVNQLGHPYQGSVYFGLARSNGLDFWQSFGYAFAGSAVWEVAGETTPPSRNDQITTSIGGTFLGEALFRMAHLVLEQGDDLSPMWRELAAAAISPPLGMNRHFRPGRGSGEFSSNSPATYARLQLGYSGTLNSNAGPALAPKLNELAGDFALEYGLPGKPGYTYDRPFDYFNFQLRVSSAHGVESLHTRGLLFGAPYRSGARVRGIAGLYGSYDYLAPQLFRVASTGLSLGSNAQWQASDSIAVQGHASAGIGYTSTGTVRDDASRQYNYGFAPQATLSLRVLLGDRLAFDTTAHKFFNGRLAHSETSATDQVLRGDAALTYRLNRNGGIALKYITSRRDFLFPGIGAQRQRRDTLGLYYVYQGSRGSGAVHW